jgi:hypothetical protein
MRREFRKFAQELEGMDRNPRGYNIKVMLGSSG